MKDERLPYVDTVSWAHESLIGQLKEWTPKAKTRNVTATTNINPLDGYIRADATSGAITLTLETAVGCDGRIHHIKKIDSSANAVTIDGNGSETIDGATTYSLASQYDHVTLVSNGSNWEIASEVGSGAATTVGAFGECQLTLNAGNLTLSAYKGNKLTFADGTVATLSSAQTLAVTGASASTLYYIYATKSGTSVNGIERSTTSYSTTNGIRHQTGDTTKLLVGLARTTSGTAWADDEKQRFVRSYFNDPGRFMRGGMYSANTQNPSFAEASSTDRMEFVCWANERISMFHHAHVYNDTNSGQVDISIAIDSTSSQITWEGADIYAESFVDAGGTGSQHSLEVHYVTTLSEGYHYATGLLKRPGATGTAHVNSGFMSGQLHGVP